MLFLLALIIFIVASFTDFLDGKLARSYNLESSLGAILDPIADKILVLFAIFSYNYPNNQRSFCWWNVSFILAREFWVSALREWLQQR